MIDWVSSINISNEFKQCKEGEITIRDLSKVVVERLKSITKRFEEEDFFLDDLIGSFEEIIGDEECFDKEELVEWFDNCLDQLFDWGDQSVGGNFNRKRCWINVSF